MAENLTIARPYAKAVFEQALADHSLVEWESMLQRLSLIAADQQAAALFDNPQVSDQQLLELFLQVSTKGGPKLSPQRQQELKNFLIVLIREKRLAVLPEIFDRYQRLMAAEREVKEVTVTSAYPLDETRRNSMIASLTRYLHSKVAVDFQEDRDLIGGAVIRCGNWVMDGSVAGKLRQLRNNLQQ